MAKPGVSRPRDTFTYFGRDLRIFICPNLDALGLAAAQRAGRILRAALRIRPRASVVFATGTSQFPILQQLIRMDIPWNRVRGFHLDEYLGLPQDHPAAFGRYLRERLLQHLPLGEFHFIDGNSADPEFECLRLGQQLTAQPIDLILLGIGENAHLAFNDPPADFQTTAAYLKVDLDDACRRQQLGEGWFPDLESVPRQAISMSIRAILSARRLICCAPEARKAAAVAAAVNGPVTPWVPASILQRHPRTWLYLDQDSSRHWVERQRTVDPK